MNESEWNGLESFLVVSLIWEKSVGFMQNLHWKLGQQTLSAGTLLAYSETTAWNIYFLGIKRFCFLR